MSEGVLRIRLESAVEQNDASKSIWQSELASALDSTVEVEWSVVPELLGGCRVVCGDSVLDLSMENRLRKLEGSLHR